MFRSVPSSQPGRASAGPMRGFALLELSIALLVATLLAIWGAGALMRHADEAESQATGIWLLEIRHAAGRMLERHFDSLAAGTRPLDEQGRAPYADAMAPTVAEFKAAGLLPPGFPETAPDGSAARVRVLRLNACPGAACRLDALVHSSQPLHTAQGEPDMMRMAVLVQAAAGYGGQATGGRDGRLRGAAFDFANPPTPDMPALPAGTPVLWAGMDVATADRYVRRFDTRDPQLRASLSTTGGVQAAGNLETDGNVSAAGSITARGGIAAGGSVSTSGRFIASEYLQMGAASPGFWCESPGLIARAPQGGVLGCRNGVWTPEDGGFGGAFATNNRFGCQHYTGVSTANPRTGNCSCPSGYAPVIVSAGGKWNDDEGWTTGYVCVR
ncbi:shufflon system plasmid conjugative transfer pilus tip adhesin PilV [Bordetella genomosp. 13]|uniref:shufflon system plasmid conjugative transfer pilus tip adhesin PilV n=1 Tax=Bordetella genomosp. 13 TaxID=463040 RepID=UPI0021B66F1B|nr:shufflon system plasmid conjugative transfer pilus tip adhesin PilV [Bordetella genomosp. 13]